MSLFNYELYKDLCKTKNQSQEGISEVLSSAYDIKTSVSAVKSWGRKENPTTPDLDKIIALADYFKVNFTDLLNIPIRVTTPANIIDYEVAMLPVMDIRVGAGSEGILPDFIDRSNLVPVSRKLLNGVDMGNLAIFQIVGDSMQPSINPDDWVIIDMVNERPFHEVDGTYLISKDGSIQIKRLHFKGTKGVDIISDNPIYPKENSKEDAIDLEIIGKLYMRIHSLGALAVE